MEPVPDSKAPADLLCPITHKLFQDPVILVESGHTYDSKAISGWLSLPGPQRDPLTGQQLSSVEIVPNMVVKKMVDRWMEQHPQPKHPNTPGSPDMQHQHDTSLPSADRFEAASASSVATNAAAAPSLLATSPFMGYTGLAAVSAAADLSSTTDAAASPVTCETSAMYSMTSSGSLPLPGQPFPLLLSDIELEPDATAAHTEAEAEAAEEVQPRSTSACADVSTNTSSACQNSGSNATAVPASNSWGSDNKNKPPPVPEHSAVDAGYQAHSTAVLCRSGASMASDVTVAESWRLKGPAAAAVADTIASYRIEEASSVDNLTSSSHNSSVDLSLLCRNVAAPASSEQRECSNSASAVQALPARVDAQQSTPFNGPASASGFASEHSLSTHGTGGVNPPATPQVSHEAELPASELSREASASPAPAAVTSAPAIAAVSSAPMLTAAIATTRSAIPGISALSGDLLPAGACSSTPQTQHQQLTMQQRVDASSTRPGAEEQAEAADARTGAVKGSSTATATLTPWIQAPQFSSSTTTHDPAGWKTLSPAQAPSCPRWQQLHQSGPATASTNRRAGDGIAAMLAKAAPPPRSHSQSSRSTQSQSASVDGVSRVSADGQQLSVGQARQRPPTPFVERSKSPVQQRRASSPLQTPSQHRERSPSPLQMRSQSPLQQRQTASQIGKELLRQGQLRQQAALAAQADALASATTQKAIAAAAAAAAKRAGSAADGGASAAVASTGDRCSTVQVQSAAAPPSSVGALAPFSAPGSLPSLPSGATDQEHGTATAADASMPYAAATAAGAVGDWCTRHAPEEAKLQQDWQMQLQPRQDSRRQQVAQWLGDGNASGHEWRGSSEQQQHLPAATAQHWGNATPMYQSRNSIEHTSAFCSAGSQLSKLDSQACSLVDRNVRAAEPQCHEQQLLQGHLQYAGTAAGACSSSSNVQKQQGSAHCAQQTMQAPVRAYGQVSYHQAPPMIGGYMTATGPPQMVQPQLQPQMMQSSMQLGATAEGAFLPQSMRQVEPNWVGRMPDAAPPHPVQPDMQLARRQHHDVPDMLPQHDGSSSDVPAGGACGKAAGVAACASADEYGATLHQQQQRQHGSCMLSTQQPADDTSAVGSSAGRLHYQHDGARSALPQWQVHHIGPEESEAGLEQGSLRHSSALDDRHKLHQPAPGVTGNMLYRPADSDVVVADAAGAGYTEFEVLGRPEVAWKEQPGGEYFAGQDAELHQQVVSTDACGGGSPLLYSAQAGAAADHDQDLLCEFEGLSPEQAARISDYTLQQRELLLELHHEWIAKQQLLQQRQMEREMAPYPSSAASNDSHWVRCDDRHTAAVVPAASTGQRYERDSHEGASLVAGSVHGSCCDNQNRTAADGYISYDHDAQQQHSLVPAQQYDAASHSTYSTVDDHMNSSASQQEQWQQQRYMQMQVQMQHYRGDAPLHDPASRTGSASTSYRDAYDAGDMHGYVYHTGAGSVSSSGRPHGSLSSSQQEGGASVGGSKSRKGKWKKMFGAMKYMVAYDPKKC